LGGCCCCLGLVFNVVIHGRCFIVDCVEEMRVYFLVLNILGKTLNKYKNNILLLLYIHSIQGIYL
jgi:hypothetical protein